MIKKGYIIIALGVVSVLLASLFVTNVLLANPDPVYDPWIDTNDDGIIDLTDVAIMAYIYGTEGVPINKTDLLLELEADIESLNWTLLNEYYNKSISDTRFAQLAHTHLGQDISYGTLGFYGGIQQIRMGSSDTNHIIYFYDSGSPTKEWFYWYGSANKFVLSDDTDFQGTVDAQSFTMDTTTRYYSVPASAWMPYRDYYVVYRSKWLYTTTSLTTIWYAPVNLPDGAVVTSLTASVYDTDATDIDVHLLRESSMGSDYMMANVSTTGTSGWQQPSDTSIDYNLIDNWNYAYYLRAYLNSGSSSHRLVKMRIAYTITEPLP